MRSFSEYRENELNESVGGSRYSVEVNFRTTVGEVLENYAKICLGYVSAALKNHGFHVKQVYEAHMPRIFVSSRNWDDGEWVVLVSWHTERRAYVLSKGFYNKDRKTISPQSSHVSASVDASGLTREIRNMMHGLKDLPDRHREKLNPVPLKRGPKRK